MVVKKVPEIVGFVEQAIAIPLKNDRKRREVIGGRPRVRVYSANEKEEKDERATEDRRTEEGRRVVPADERCGPAGGGPHLSEKG